MILAAVSKGKILHITPWFPTEEDPGFAIWIKRHIDSLEEYDNHIMHLQIIPKGLAVRTKREGSLKRILIRIPTGNWRIREMKFFAMLCWQLLWKYRTRDYKCINFHIAYPSCVYLKWIARLIKCPILITEHWSYYHFHFFSKKKLTRVKRIFSGKIHLITVSDQLYKDIREFSGYEPAQTTVPNVVDTKAFAHTHQERAPQTYFMVSFWRDHKQPLEVLEAIKTLREDMPSVQLRIGGYGPQVPGMEAFVKEHKLEAHCTFLGRLEPEEIAHELNLCSALIHPTVYETFSVVCAEAQCCGTPVISNPVGALPEYLDSSNSHLRAPGESWASAIETVSNKQWDYSQIAAKAAQRFDKEVIGRLYSQVIEQL